MCRWVRHSSASSHRQRPEADRAGVGHLDIGVVCIDAPADFSTHPALIGERLLAGNHAGRRRRGLRRGRVGGTENGIRLRRSGRCRSAPSRSPSEEERRPRHSAIGPVGRHDGVPTGDVDAAAGASAQAGQALLRASTPVRSVPQSVRRSQPHLCQVGYRATSSTPCSLALASASRWMPATIATAVGAGLRPSSRLPPTGAARAAVSAWTGVLGGAGGSVGGADPGWVGRQERIRHISWCDCVRAVFTLPRRRGGGGPR
jgi:hypothetical protein